MEDPKAEAEAYTDWEYEYSWERGLKIFEGQIERTIRRFEKHSGHQVDQIARTTDGEIVIFLNTEMAEKVRQRMLKQNEEKEKKDALSSSDETNIQ